MTKTIKATRCRIPPLYFAQAEIDRGKVLAIARHLLAGGEVPPVVTALYGDRAMPLDGHHRMVAHAILKRAVEAWVVEGDQFDELCCEERDAERFVICGGVRAMAVASAWHAAREAGS